MNPSLKRVKLKVNIIGDTHSGKTSFIRNLVSN
jgi:GTPase SAR1 family protein